MSKQKKKGHKIPKEIAGVKLPKQLRRTGEALLAQAASPQGQAVLAKGLTMAAGFASMAAARSAKRAETTGAPDSASQPAPAQPAPPAPSPRPAESAEGVVPPSPAEPSPSPATPPPFDAAKIAETVNTVAEAVLGRLFAKR